MFGLDWREGRRAQSRAQRAQNRARQNGEGFAASSEEKWVKKVCDHLPVEKFEMVGEILKKLQAE
eukprot:3934944-Rhodomonas_salina.6